MTKEIPIMPGIDINPDNRYSSRFIILTYGEKNA